MNFKSQFLVVSLLLPFTLFAQITEVMITKSENAEGKNSSDIYFVVEEKPIFQYKDFGSTNVCFRRYMSDSLRIPSIDCFGTVYIQFVVETDSTVGNVKILSELENCEGFKEETIRILYSMPKWIPGKQNGNTVRVMMTMPINFHPHE